MKYFSVPDYEDYYATEDGRIISHKKNVERELVQTPDNSTSKSRGRLKVTFSIDGVKKTMRVSRVVLSAKLQRPLEDWEHARHKDGNSRNNHMSNLYPGCALLNLIDDLENGTRLTSDENIDEAIDRLLQLREVR